MKRQKRHDVSKDVKVNFLVLGLSDVLKAYYFLILYIFYPKHVGNRIRRKNGTD